MAKIKRRELSDRHKAAQQNLFRIWSTKKKLLGLTQESAAGKLGLTQGAVFQYLNGKIPLNTDAVLAFSALLQVDPSEIDKKIGVLDKIPKKLLTNNVVTIEHAKMEPAKLARILDEIQQYEIDNKIDPPFRNAERAHFIKKLYSLPDNADYRAEIAEIIEFSKVLRRP
jgi:transcriptional regulator with XRE-family HTH domain